MQLEQPPAYAPSNRTDVRRVNKPRLPAHHHRGRAFLLPLCSVARDGVIDDLITQQTANETRRDHDTASEFTTAPNSVLAQEIK